MEENVRIVRSEEEIKSRISELAGEIRSRTPEGLTVVGVLDDVFVFMADLIRELDVPLSCCFIKVTHHRHGGQTEIMFTSEFDPCGRDILLVSGVAATGVTLDYVARQLSARAVKSLRTCVLIDKPGERRIDLKPDFAALKPTRSLCLDTALAFRTNFDSSRIWL